MLKRISKLSLRLRTFLFFVFLGLCVPLVLGPTFYFAYEHILTHNDPASSMFLFGIGGSLGILLCIIAIGALFDVNVASPIQA